MPVKKSGILDFVIDIRFFNQLIMLAYSFFFIFTFASGYSRATVLYLLGVLWFFSALLIDVSWLSRIKLLLAALAMYLLLLLFNDLLIGTPTEIKVFLKNYIYFFFFLFMGLFYTFNFEKFRFNLTWKIMLLMLFISYVATFLGLLKYPSASRDLASSGIHEMNSYYQKIGIGGFSFIYHSFYLMIALIFLINKKMEWYVKAFLVFFIFFIYITIFKSNYTTALLLASLSLVLAVLFVSGKYTGIKLLLLVLAGILLLIFSVPILQFIVNFIFTDESNTIRIRLVELLEFLTGEVSFNRVELLKLSIEAFLKNPLLGEFGKIKTVGGHSDFFDTFGSFGLVGTVLYNTVLFSAIYYQYKSLKTPKYRRCMLIIHFILFLSRFTNTLLYSHSIACVVFLLCPILLYSFDKAAQAECSENKTARNLNENSMVV